MKNPFEVHGITHLSVSQLNLWAAAPGVYLLERVLHEKTPAGASAKRGQAVEDGVVLALTGEASLQEAQDHAINSFDAKTGLSVDPRRQRERDGIPGMVQHGFNLLKPWGKPEATQVKKEWQMEGVAVPMLGFSDFEYYEHGLIVDLKTSHQIPSEIKTTHARQVGSYIGPEANFEGGVAYVSSKKSVMYKLENAREHVKSLTRIALSLQKFLSVSDDPYELASMITVDTESFYLADRRARSAAWKIYGV